MKVWISTVGWSSFAVINPLWAACFLEQEYFIPEKVVLLNNATKNETIRKNCQIVKSWIEQILKEYDVEKPIFKFVNADEDNMNEFTEVFKQQFQKYKNDTVAIDMTPGRKFMSSIAMSIAIKNKVEKLYYLHLWGREYQDLPFIKIPLINQKLINIMELLDE